jgi:hypothetical protein
MYCSRCGNKVGDNHIFCAKCGNKIRPDGQAAFAGQTGQPPVPQMQPVEYPAPEPAAQPTEIPFRNPLTRRMRTRHRHMTLCMEDMVGAAGRYWF